MEPISRPGCSTRRDDGARAGAGAKAPTLPDHDFRRYLAAVAHFEPTRIDEAIGHLHVFRERVPRTVRSRELAIEVFERAIRRDRPPEEAGRALDALRHYWYAVDRTRAGAPGD